LQAKKKEKLAVGPLMLAFFVFVVIGSGALLFWHKHPER